MKHLIKALVTSLTLLLFSAPYALAQSVPKLINYQGKLTDASANAVPNGTYGVAFRVWSKKASTESGDQLIWGRDYDVAAANGVFNVILGAPGGTPVPGAAVNDLGYAFGESTRFIGLTVTRGTNGTVISGATEIIPRQQVLASPYALNAANGSPVGGIILWWGDIGSIPENFELCDGQPPSTPGATLTGSKPDLRDRFPKGATSGATDVKSSPIAGGSNFIGQRQSGGTAITIAQMPSHTHGVNDPGHSHTMDSEFDFNSTDNHIARGSGSPGPLPTASAVTGISIQSAGGGGAHDHVIPGHDNRPAFLEVFYVIRVK